VWPALAQDRPTLPDPPETWHLPSSAPTPKGLVILNHGFARRCAHLHSLAEAMSAAGWAVVCRNRDGAPETSAVWMARLQANRLTPTELGAVPTRWVLAGHSAGGAEAARLARDATYQAPGHLAGVLLLDPVARDNAALAEQLAQLATANTPVLAIVSTPSRCNAQGRSERTVRDAERAGPQVQVAGPAPGSTHLDAEGSSTDALAVAACGEGRPQPPLVAALQAQVQVFLKRLAPLR
jgi:pimeloyl-ACP methyl ester carboxylesterase